MKSKEGEERVMYRLFAHMNAEQAAWVYMCVVGEVKTERRYALLERLIGAGWDVYITREMTAYGGRFCMVKNTIPIVRCL